jgi:hypothetical protein
MSEVMARLWKWPMSLENHNYEIAVPLAQGHLTSNSRQRKK